MDQIEERLRETSEKCFNCYETWQQNKKSSDAREALQEAIHELRKVASRLEIELAISERDEMAQKPIPIPPHRDAKRRNHDGFEEEDHRQPEFNHDGNAPSPARQQHSQPRRRPYPGKKPMGGSGGGGSNGGN
jgi:hypothetical protein